MINDIPQKRNRPPPDINVWVGPSLIFRPLFGGQAGPPHQEKRLLFIPLIEV